ncbi:peptidylprolyl isomerase [Candidatus Pacearchaeota archaeon]|nr:peptidylprolyl isomerase [Candidatus Pacearchaeota archaeon]
METVKKNDIIELSFSGYANGNLFDSNVPENLKKIHPEAKAEPLIVVIGQGMVVPGLDKALEDKEIGKQYEVSIPVKDGFGERRKDLLRTLPLKVFHAQQIQPYPGQTLLMDGSMAKVIAVSGARVMTDFNSPLAGKDLLYKFTITKKVTDEKERCNHVLKIMFRNIPEFEIGEKITIKGPKTFEILIKAFNDKFKEIIGKELDFELKEDKKEEENMASGKA